MKKKSSDTLEVGIYRSHIVDVSSLRILAMTLSTLLTWYSIGHKIVKFRKKLTSFINYSFIFGFNGFGVKIHQVIELVTVILGSLVTSVDKIIVVLS